MKFSFDYLIYVSPSRRGIFRPSRGFKSKKISPLTTHHWCGERVTLYRAESNWAEKLPGYAPAHVISQLFKVTVTFFLHHTVLKIKSLKRADNKKSIFFFINTKLISLTSKYSNR